MIETTNETRLKLECWADPDPLRRGWIGRYQTDKGVRTVTNRLFRRSALIFPSEIEAKVAAGDALLRYLNANPRPRSSGTKTFAVARNGRNVRTIHLPQRT